MDLGSIDGVCDLHLVCGADADASRPPSLLLEVAHGATATADFERLASQLHGPFPPGLIDFFHVNTDAGAPELAHRLAERLVQLEPTRSAMILRCRVPRTFIDVNRVLDMQPEAYTAGGVTPGLPPYVRDPRDLALLHRLYDSYQAVARRAFQGICGAGGAALLVHSYAPRSVDVQVDDDIVVNLRRAYEPDRVNTWPLRPEVDIIGRGTDGVLLAPEPLVEAVERELGGVGIEVGVGVSYPLHPSTTAYHHALRYPGRTLCLEVRRDLLAEPFSPFVQMHIDPAKVERLARPMAAAFHRWWAGA